MYKLDLPDYGHLAQDIPHAPRLTVRQRRPRSNGTDRSDDRGLRDTSDNTLWYDKNGDKSGGETLIADLKASANVEANDIFII